MKNKCLNCGKEIEEKDKAFCSECELLFWKSFFSRIKKGDKFIICQRCGHMWKLRKAKEEIKVCPKCKSPYFDKPKK